MSALDPQTLGFTGLVLVAMAVAASLVPAVRATRISPSQSLRTE